MGTRQRVIDQCPFNSILNKSMPALYHTNADNVLLFTFHTTRIWACGENWGNRSVLFVFQQKQNTNTTLQQRHEALRSPRAPPNNTPTFFVPSLPPSILLFTLDCQSTTTTTTHFFLSSSSSLPSPTPVPVPKATLFNNNNKHISPFSPNKLHHNHPAATTIFIIIDQQ